MITVFIALLVHGSAGSILADGRTLQSTHRPHIYAQKN